jgi:hypothetical protein
VEAVGLVSKRLKLFIDDRFGGNINKASFYMDLDYNAVYRIYHDKMERIPFFLACKILRLTNPGEYKAILLDLYRSEMDTIAALIPSEQGSDDIEIADKRFELAISSKEHYSIYSRALERNGLPKAVIVRELGERGVEVAGELVAAGLIYERAEVFFSLLQDKLLRPDLKIVRTHGHRHLDSVDLGTPGVFMENPFGGLNDDGVKAFYALLEETAQKAVGIFQNPALKGDQTYLVTIAGGLLAKSKKEGEQ